MSRKGVTSRIPGSAASGIELLQHLPQMKFAFNQRQFKPMPIGMLIMELWNAVVHNGTKACEAFDGTTAGFRSHAGCHLGALPRLSAPAKHSLIESVPQCAVWEKHCSWSCCRPPLGLAEL